MWSSTWWPATGYRNYGSGAIVNVGYTGYYWSSTRYTSAAYCSYSLTFGYNGTVNPSNTSNRSTGFSIRCVQEEARALRAGPGTWDLGALAHCFLLGSLDYARDDTVMGPGTRDMGALFVCGGVRAVGVCLQTLRAEASPGGPHSDNAQRTLRASTRERHGNAPPYYINVILSNAKDLIRRRHDFEP